ncbi:MAG: DUF1249 domain-containing protein [Gammaproteobacteria bacterium]|nr:DUF1249 domain-containing protein [Gammaproteobacteria bacterium]MYD81083.1 DUF1249 domain-containing protein [Gammaproteobacteria bacterium]
MLFIQELAEKTLFPRRYRFDLLAHLAECDANYMRLCRLMQDLNSGEFREVSVLVSSVSESIRFVISESSRYTTTITIAQRMPAGIRDLMLVVRAYHDVQCAEVISFQGQRQFAEKLVYPKDKMRAPDEKAQVNRLLGELLTLCLKKGRTSRSKQDKKELPFIN